MALTMFLKQWPSMEAYPKNYLHVAPSPATFTRWEKQNLKEVNIEVVYANHIFVKADCKSIWHDKNRDEAGSNNALKSNIIL